MVRTAVLVSDSGARLQTVLDSVYFGEIPNFELAAVIFSAENAQARRRCKNAGVEPIVVDAADFPTQQSYSTAITNKLRDLDIELVVLAGYHMPLGQVAQSFKGRILGTCPTLVPMFEGVSDPITAAMDRGCLITGATAYFAAPDGGIGRIIDQQPVELRPEDNRMTLERRIIEEAEWKLLPKAIALYCQGKL